MNTEGEPSPEDMGLNPEDMKVPGLERADKPDNQKPQKSENLAKQGGNPDEILQDIAREEKPTSSKGGWDSVDTSHGEEDFIVSTEQKAEAERVEARMSVASLAVDTAIPSKSREELVEIAKANLPIPGKETQHTPETVDDGDWVGMERVDESTPSIVTPPPQEDIEADKLQEKGQVFRKAFAVELAKTQIPETDFQEYASEVYTAAKELTEPDKDLRYFSQFVRDVESVEQARLINEFAHTWRERFLTSTPDERVWRNRANNFSQFIGEVSGAHRSPRPEPLSLEETSELFDAVADVYETAYLLPETDEDQKIFQTFTQGAIKIGRESHNADQTRNVLQIYKEVAEDPDRTLVERTIDTAIRYGVHHGLTDDAREGIINKLIPAMRFNDPQVEILNRGGNIWGMKQGDFGIADFLVHSYALRVTPDHINELLMAGREVPTTDLAMLEQNRLDGLTMAAPFGILRDFIHDQRPYTHDVIGAMIKFYDTGDGQQLKATLDKTGSGYFEYEVNREPLFNRERYDKSTVERRSDRNPEKKTVKPIDVLRRLEDNTKPVEDKSPETSDREFNSLLQRLSENNNQEVLQQTLDYANSRLIEMMQKGEIGIDPNHILAFAFLDKKGFQILQSLKYEDQLGVYKQKWFHSILRFQELTASASKYNEDEFRHFVNKVIYSESPKAAYRLIVQRELDNVSKLASTYKAKGKRNWVEALWSGNSAHELIGLTDLRSASTVAGRKHREEAILRDSKSGYHSGD